jgi:hypothetical protein
MNNQLTQLQKDEMRNAMSNNTFYPKVEIIKLVAEGYEVEVAKDLVIAEIKAYKSEVFQEAIQREKESENSKLIHFGVLVIAIIGPILKVQSAVWYFIALIIAGVGGYFAFRHKPVAGVISAIIGTAAFPFAYNFYITGRDRIIKIEMLIPMLIAAAPAVIMFYILSAVMYNNSHNN